ncbi:Heat shock transcription factor [Lecanora helva]
MPSAITRKRPASAISTSEPDQVRGTKSQNRGSTSPRAVEDPPQVPMQSARVSQHDLSAFSDPSNPYNAGLHDAPYYTNQQAQTTARSSGNELVRAHANNQMVPIANYDDRYPVAGTELAGIHGAAENGFHGRSQYDDLDHRALLAENDAQGKRKGIPPFVQKLSSFLNEDTRNTNLIRWSDSGDSFIVVDEDEFARTLIPELFKHNNYASFVRQLNMYGFHKKVGLSDNSLRASERKNKNPSEYSNPYFKRGKPNLLWLIHKPKNGPPKGGGKGNTRAKQEDVEEDADDFLPRDSPAPPNREHAGDGQNPLLGRQQLALPPINDRIPPEQLKSLQQEMAEIRLQQRKITEMLQFARKENLQLYSQAKAFHELHEKHDNSINAILTFLATVYNKNMSDKGVDFRNMFASNTLPSQEESHEIFNVDDEKSDAMASATRPNYPRRKPLLLKDKASPAEHADSPKGISQWPASTFPDPEKPNNQSLHSPAVQEIHDQSLSNRGSESPQIDSYKQQYNSNANNNAPNKTLPQADILSAIQRQNAQNNQYNGTPMEFPEVLSHMQNTNGQSPLTPSQQQNMLKLMSNEQNTSFPNGNNNNALTSYNPSNSSANLAHFSMNSEQLSQIEQSLRDQEARMANMQATIAPLSPSGSIPGMNDNTSFNPNPELDIDSIFNTGDYFNDGIDPNNSNNFDFTNGGMEFPDFDFSTGAVTEPANAGAQEHLGVDDEARVKEMDSSEATSPAATVHTVEEDERPEESPRKLRRRG